MSKRDHGYRHHKLDAVDGVGHWTGPLDNRGSEVDRRVGVGERVGLAANLPFEVPPQLNRIDVVELLVDHQVPTALERDHGHKPSLWRLGPRCAGKRRRKQRQADDTSVGFGVSIGHAFNHYGQEEQPQWQAGLCMRSDAAARATR